MLVFGHAGGYLVLEFVALSGICRADDEEVTDRFFAQVGNFAIRQRCLFSGVPPVRGMSSDGVVLHGVS